jgi:GTP-binding protein
MIIDSAKFIKSASKLSECPSEKYPEFAFVGRSNVGKSSLINMLTQKKGLAKSSITPGKTQLLNYFLINDSRYMVDLPGYGYAKYSKEKRIQWIDTMQHYLTQRSTISTVFLVIDGSIPPQNIDLDFIQMLKESQISFDIIISKIDKSTQKNIHHHLALLKSHLQEILGKLPNIFKISNTKARGRQAVREYITQKIST